MAAFGQFCRLTPWPATLPCMSLSRDGAALEARFPTLPPHNCKPAQRSSSLHSVGAWQCICRSMRTVACARVHVAVPRPKRSRTKLAARNIRTNWDCPGQPPGGWGEVEVLTPQHATPAPVPDRRQAEIQKPLAKKGISTHGQSRWPGSGRGCGLRATSSAGVAGFPACRADVACRGTGMRCRGRPRMEPERMRHGSRRQGVVAHD